MRYEGTYKLQATPAGVSCQQYRPKRLENSFQSFPTKQTDAHRNGLEAEYHKNSAVYAQQIQQFPHGEKRLFFGRVGRLRKLESKKVERKKAKCKVLVHELGVPMAQKCWGTRMRKDNLRHAGLHDLYLLLPRLQWMVRGVDEGRLEVPASRSPRLSSFFCWQWKRIDHKWEL